MDSYKAYLEEQGLAATTINPTIDLLNKYSESFGLNANQDTTLDNLLTYANGSPRQTMTSAISKYRSFMKYENDKIKASVDTLKTETDDIREFCSDFLNGIINNIVINSELESTRESKRKKVE